MLNSSVAPWPSYSEEEIAAVSAILRSGRVNYWTGGETREFEREFAEFASSDHAIGLANGTLALDLALRGLGVGPGDEVVVTPRTFIASVSSVISVGAMPVFADVDLDSGNISPGTIGPVLTDRTRAIIAVHLGGWPCDMPGIMSLCRGRDIAIIEDCAQAHGARIGARSVGSFGDVGAWSFCQDKIMTTGGEGGAATCSDETLWRRMWSYKDHGKDWDAIYNRKHAPGFRWLHESFGTNWRMMEVQAAIGRIQLRKMQEWQSRRSSIAARYIETLAPYANAVRVPQPGEGLVNAWYRCYAYVRPEGLARGWDRDRIVAEVAKQSVPLLHGTCSEVYLEKAFENTGYAPARRLTNARELGATSIMMLTHPTMTDADVGRICTALDEVFAKASR